MSDPATGVSPAGSGRPAVGRPGSGPAQDTPPRPGRPRPGNPEAETVARAVLRVDTVAALSAGPAGQTRTYLPGGRSVPGVVFDGDALQIAVVTHYGPPLDKLGKEIVTALGPLADGHTVTVRIDDIVLPGEPAPDTADSVVESAPEPTPPAESESGPEPPVLPHES